MKNFITAVICVILFAMILATAVIYAGYFFYNQSIDEIRTIIAVDIFVEYFAIWFYKNYLAVNNGN